MTKAEESLAPCPFCGSKDLSPDCAHIYAGEECCQIRCNNCRAAGPIFGRKNPAKVIEVAGRGWDTRHSPFNLTLDGLRELVESCEMLLTDLADCCTRISCVRDEESTQQSIERLRAALPTPREERDDG